VTAGHNEKVDVVVAEEVVMDHDKVLGEQGPVALHHAFRFAGGAACVHDNPGVLTVYLRGRFFRTRLCHGIFVRLEAVVLGVIKAEGNIMRHGR
jgi:hypothetical protein